MKDFYNKKKEAVWICKVCGKWLSEESLLEIHNCIICKKWNCKQELEKSKEIIEFNSKSIKKFKNWNVINSLFSIILWVIFLLTWIHFYLVNDNYIIEISFWLLFIFMWIYGYFYWKSIIRNKK